MANELLKIDTTFQKIMSDTMRDMADTPINHTSPGSVAKLLLSKVNQQLAAFYQRLELEHMKPMLSKATDRSLDLVGELLNCHRQTDEGDENYRYRISRQSLALEKANETAIRLAVLSIPMVKDVILKEYTQGTGSFSVYPIVDNPRTITGDFLEQIQGTVNNVKGYGTRGTVLIPRLTPVELRARLLFDDRAPQVDRTLTMSQATDFIRATIASLKPGGTLSLDEMKREILRMDENLINLEFYHFLIGDKPMVAVNQTSVWNEQYIEADTPRAILVS